MFYLCIHVCVVAAERLQLSVSYSSDGTAVQYVTVHVENCLYCHQWTIVLRHICWLSLLPALNTAAAAATAS